MYIKKLELTNFKNYEYLNIDFDPNINIFIGKNAQGKTNLLESVYFLSLIRSFKNYGIKEVIMFDKEFSKLNAIVLANDSFHELELVLNENGKKASVDRKDIRKSSDFIGILNAVLFTPDDLNLIKGYPAERRNFIDIELCKISPAYLFNFNKYYKLLKERNKYLKILNNKHISHDDYLDVLTEQMANLQMLIIKKRKEFLIRINDKANLIYKFIADNDENIELEYKNSFHLENITYEEIMNKYQENVEKDIRKVNTSYGIHKDDIKIFINGKDANLFGSQGQQRTIVLALKIALIEIIKEEIGEYPVLLLDDVLSELDDSRKTMLLNIIDGKIQTLITTTSIDGIKHNTISKAKKFIIENGKII